MLPVFLHFQKVSICQEHLPHPRKETMMLQLDFMSRVFIVILYVQLCQGTINQYANENKLQIKNNFNKSIKYHLHNENKNYQQSLNRYELTRIQFIKNNIRNIEGLIIQSKFVIIYTIMHKKQKLKQPTKYSHVMVERESEEQQPQDQVKGDIAKTKKIKKKAIKKQNQPSAIRHQKINETFDKIEAEGENLINSFKLSNSLDQIVKIDKRSKCQKCNKTAKFYCMNCFERCCQIEFPKVKLPISIQILHHSSEKAQRSSIIPMKMISNEINVYKYAGNKIQGQKAVQKFDPKLDFNKQQTFILYPHKNSKVVTLQDIPKLKRIMVLDCTWFQTDQMIDSLTQLGYNNYIRLEGYKSVYWRYNHHSDKALSSAQSLLYFMREYSQAKKEDIHQYDDLMFLYLLNLKMVMNQQKKRINNQQNQKS